MGGCFSQPNTASLTRETSQHRGRSGSIPGISSGWISTPSDFLPACEPLRLLGEGTFGTVVLVRERATKKLLAVKVMNKSQLVHEAQLDSIVTERQVLREAGPHPFIVECHSGFQTDNAVVLVLEYVAGGDMYDLMRKHGCFSESDARFYLAEITVAVAELHRHDFVFRDLKLENILIDSKGHVRLTDFGLAGKFSSGAAAEKAIFDISGTAIYQAPEMLNADGHGRVVDWWALGVLAYVLLAGRPPFSSESREDLYKNIKEQDLDLENDERLSQVSDVAKQFIKQLLDKNPETRLGSSNDDASEVQRHPFFENIDWGAVLRFQLDPPLAPARKAPSNDEEDASPNEVKIAQRKLADKVLTKHKPIKSAPRSTNKNLDVIEYKPVRVQSKRDHRVSIGLDFEGKNAKAAGKTWTGTADDFGRVIPR